jgi:wobble nucleotide-excising tRNase
MAETDFMSEYRTKGMISSISGISGLGRIKDGQDLPLAKFTLVYGENGTGKSTLCALFRAVRDKSKAPVQEYARLKGSGEASAKFTYSDAKKAVILMLDELILDKNIQVLIFDETFVERYVYVGRESGTDQRRAFLEVIVGDEAVKIRKELDSVSRSQVQLARDLTTKEINLKALVTPLDIDTFQSIAETGSLEEGIAELEQQIKSHAQITTFTEADRLHVFGVVPTLDSLYPFLTMRKNISKTILSEGIQKFLASKNDAGFEEWLRSGLTFFKTNGNSCPMCGSIGSVPFLEELRSHLDNAFQEYTDSFLLKVRSTRTAVDTYRSFCSQLDVQNQTKSTRISKLIPGSPALPDFLEFTVVLSDACEQLGTLANLVSEGSTSDQLEISLGRIRESMIQLSNFVASYNTIASTLNKVVDSHVASSTSDESKALLSRLQQLTHVRSIGISNFTVAKLRLQVLKRNYDAVTTEKARLTALMEERINASLDTSMIEVNQILKDLGARFQLAGAKQTSSGGQPQLAYSVHLSDFDAFKQAGTGKAGSPSFKTVLSDGDRRCLAFAVFLFFASQRNLEETVVVLDDPLVSVDWARRRRTVSKILGIANQGAQILLLSHDAQFLFMCEHRLQNVNRSRKKANLTTIESTAIEVARRGARSQLVPCDLFYTSRGEYERHRIQLAEYVAGERSLSAETVPNLCRKTVEGFFVIRDPQFYGLTLGQMLAKVRNDKEKSGDVGEFGKRVLTHLVKFHRLLEYADPESHLGDRDVSQLMDADAQVLAEDTLKLLESL